MPPSATQTYVIQDKRYLCEILILRWSTGEEYVALRDSDIHGAVASFDITAVSLERKPSEVIVESFSIPVALTA
ncbi:MAG: hypothetical protein A4E19_05075 [Nitrospira sp. SG-bin1]|nr:MAG: hypothetical protein A4E19_05075 [Nitrospira sp. SG-bin1]